MLDDGRKVCWSVKLDIQQGVVIGSHDPIKSGTKWVTWIKSQEEFMGHPFTEMNKLSVLNKLSTRLVATDQS